MEENSQEETHSDHSKEMGTPLINPGFTPEELVEVLLAGTEAECALVGGQAINLWSNLFSKKGLDPWSSLHPYTSRDVDFYATQKSVKKLVVSLEVRGFKVDIAYPKNSSEEKFNLAALKIENRSLSLDVNILRTVSGISNNIEEWTQEVPLLNKIIKTIHPLNCVESKLFNLFELNQADRQDEKHLRLAVANLSVYIEETANKAPDETLEIVEILANVSKRPSALGILKTYQIDILNSIPINFLRAHSHSVLKEIGDRAMTVRGERDQVVADERELKEWLLSLNPSPHKQVDKEISLSKYKDLPNEITPQKNAKISP